MGPRAVVSLLPPRLPMAHQEIQRSLRWQNVLPHLGPVSKQVQSPKVPTLNNKVTGVEGWPRLLGYRISVGGVRAKGAAT